MTEETTYLKSEQPKPAWRCTLFGCHGSATFLLFVAEGDQPNWFWRLMQYWAFGNKWERLP